MSLSAMYQVLISLSFGLAIGEERDIDVVEADVGIAESEWRKRVIVVHEVRLK